MLQYEREILNYNLTYNSYLCVLASGIPFYRMMANEIMRVRNGKERSLILLINCERRCKAIELHANFKIVQLPSELMAFRRPGNYFSGGVFCTSFRTLAIDLFSLRLSPTLIDGIFVILSRQMMDTGTYLPMIFDKYMKGNKQGVIRVYTDRVWHIKSLKLLKKLHLNDVLLVPRVHCSVINSLTNTSSVESN